MPDLREISDNIKELQAGDWIAFPWSYYAGKEKEIMVSNITAVGPDNQYFITHFLHGYQSVSETIKATDIVAIGSETGKTKIKLWSGGYFHLLKPEDETFIKWQERFKDR